MSIRKIKDLKVIKKLEEHEEYYERFKILVNDYGNNLDTGAIVRDIGFTPHDFSHHCKDIYEILGYILPNEFYTAYPEGSNLFLLLTAVLLHDISMAQDSSESARRNHSELSKQYIEKEIFEKDNTALNKYCGKDFAEALGEIVLAHSDIKGENGEINKFTFREVVAKYADRSNYVTVKNEELNVPFLAAVLRLADELDISYHRIESTDYKNKVNTEDSKKHYQICEYFRQVQINEDKPHELLLKVVEQQFEALPDTDKPAIAGQIVDRFLKIKGEFNYLYKEVLSSNKFAANGIWNIDAIKLKDEKKYREHVKKKEFL